MTSPKNAAKKVAAKHTQHDDAGKDLRRAYEHLGRVGLLHGLLDKGSTREIAHLTMLAEQEIASGYMKDAADLLRAAEHLSFGVLNSPKAEKYVNRQLVDAITREFGHKLEKADEHWSDEEEHHKELGEIFSQAVERAQRAFDDGAYRQALEFARGAEALAHVRVHNPGRWGSGPVQHKLKS